MRAGTMSHLSTLFCHLCIIGILLATVRGDNPTTTDGPTTTPEPPVTWFECPDQYSYHSHPQNCTQYLICVFGKPYLRACEGGLHWNERLKNCDWPNPKTTCVQMDDNTAFRPDLSPSVTAPPMPSESDNSDADNNWQYQSGGKYGGSQPLSRFKPDEDAARSQLSDYAGKKVVYYDSAANDQQAARKPADDRGNNQKPQQSGDQFADADSSRQQSEPSREKLVRKKQDEFMPIGQIRRSDQPSGPPLRMSSSDMGNDDFSAQGSRDGDQQNTQPQQQQQQRQQQRPPAQQELQAATNAPGIPPPWAAALLAKKNGRPPISRDPPPPIMSAQSWNTADQDDVAAPQRQSPLVRNQIPRPNSQSPSRGSQNSDSFGTPPPPTLAPRRQEPPQRQQPPPPQRQSGQSSWPSRGQGQDSPSDQSRDQGSRGRPESGDFGQQPQKQSGMNGGRLTASQQAPERSPWSGGAPADESGPSAESFPSLHQSNAGPQSQRGSPASFSSHNQDQQPPRQPPQPGRPAPRPNALAFAPLEKSPSGSQTDSGQRPSRRVNPSPFSPNAITNSFSGPPDSRSSPQQSDDSRGNAPVSRNPPSRQSGFGSMNSDFDSADDSRFGGQTDNDDQSGFQMNFATRRPRPDASRGGPDQSAPGPRRNPPSRLQNNGDLSDDNERSPPPNRLQVHNLFSEGSDDGAPRRNPAPSNQDRSPSRKPAPAGDQDDRQWSAFGGADDSSIKDQIAQLSQRFPGLNDDSSFGGQDKLRTRMQFSAKPPPQQFPFESDSSQGGSGGQRFPFENAQDEGSSSDSFPSSSGGQRGGAQRQSNSRPMSFSSDDQDLTAPSMFSEQRMRQFYAGI